MTEHYTKKTLVTAAVVCLFATLVIMTSWECCRATSTDIEIRDNQNVEALIASARQKYAGVPALSVLPEGIDITKTQAQSPKSVYSYDGISFGVPWKETPLVRTSTPNGLLTFLTFENGAKTVEVFAASVSISRFVSGARSSYLSGVENVSSTSRTAVLNAISKYFGRSVITSDQAFVSSSLASVPMELGTSPAGNSLVLATAFLPTKYYLLQLLSNDVYPIDNISSLYDITADRFSAFEFVGSDDLGSTTVRAAHLLFIDSSGTPFNLLTLGATQKEDMAILESASLR